jgi:DNA-binding response OmpR family regulator
MRNILLVEDEVQIRAALKTALEDEGYKVEEAKDGNQAIKSFKNCLPDLVITDLVMPDKEGLQTIREMRALSPEIKIIAMSGGGRNDSKTYLKMAQSFGAAYVLDKPFSITDFLDIVNKMLD